MNKIKKHPYYDSKKKMKKEEGALKAIAFCIISMTILFLIFLLS
tara:strand:- start:106 stop:237 length:132 start_codon:yes stop_codon:yes gene_type:complete